MPNDEGKYDFLGESPIKWMAFIAIATIWLIIWGRIIAYLGGAD